MYTVIGANGKERPTTVRDARKLRLVPSVTGIIKCAAAPGLEYWIQQQVLMAALTLPRRPHESEKSFLDRVWTDSREQSKKAAERGTAIHAAIQDYFTHGRQFASEYAEHVEGAAEAIGEKSSALACEQSFTHRTGFGGKCDIHDPICNYVIDIKTKEFDEHLALQTYDEHHMQLAAYREGLGMPQARCAILYVSASVPGLARLIWIDTDDLLRGWSMFQSLHRYWQAKHKYIWTPIEKEPDLVQVA